MPRIVTTFICRADCPSGKAFLAKINASIHHVQTLQYRLRAFAGEYTHKFSQFDRDVQTGLEFITLGFRQLRQVNEPSELEKIDMEFYAQYVYGTTAIEKTTLNLREVAKVIEKGVTPATDRAISDVVTVANFKDVQALLKSYSGHRITERLIKELHSTMMYGIKDNDGKPIPSNVYRQETKVEPAESEYSSSGPEMIAKKMKQLIAEHGQNHKSLIMVHSLERAALFHQKFEEMRPFQHGNGLVGRELLNFMLTRSGFPPIYITPNEKSKYIQSLKAGNNGNLRPLIHFIILRMIATTKLYSSSTPIGDILFRARKFHDLWKEIDGGLDGFERIIKEQDK